VLARVFIDLMILSDGSSVHQACLMIPVMIDRLCFSLTHAYTHTISLSLFASTHLCVGIISRELRETTTGLSNTSVGTFKYMSPERWVRFQEPIPSLTDARGRHICTDIPSIVKITG
jgi:hypothetical protein